MSPRELAIVAVQGFFGAYMIAAERGRLDELPGDIDRLWRLVAVTRLVSLGVNEMPEGTLRTR